MQKLIITGNVGRDAEIKANPNTQELFATFSVGVSEGTKDNKKTVWYEVTCNGKLVDIAKNYVKKGGKVLIEGKPKANAYNDKDGVLRVKLGCKANIIELLGRPTEQDGEYSGETDSNE